MIRKISQKNETFYNLNSHPFFVVEKRSDQLCVGINSECFYPFNGEHTCEFTTLAFFLFWYTLKNLHTIRREKLLLSQLSGHNSRTRNSSSRAEDFFFAQFHHPEMTGQWIADWLACLFTFLCLSFLTPLSKLIALESTLHCDDIIYHTDYIQIFERSFNKELKFPMAWPLF